MSRRFLLVTATGIVVVAAVTVAALSGRTTTARTPTEDVTSPVATSHAADSVAHLRDAVSTPVVSTAANSGATPKPTYSPAASQRDPVGTVQAVPSGVNPQVALVVSALQQHDHPERLSTLVQPPAFVPGSDPAAYAAEVAPGRVFESAQPGPGVPVLSPVGPTQLNMDQDGRVYLRARSQPGSVVTFTSLDLGTFQNALASETVVADANGVASVAFTAGPGTIDAVHVLAGSPVASGQVAYHIMVTSAVAAGVTHAAR